eukprot:TRINITY_DN7934_c0_g1_i4.p1 TRINITY_DN7934_c0_g1~~TRINITY_DN7934_c0_g1_i4.p1  ORF type:complete len:242 (-),score=14.06 TRINITY_DN7934_c0_g1_i4:107-832(-)
MNQEAVLLHELTELAGRINRHQLSQSKRQLVEERRILNEMAYLSGLINQHVNESTSQDHPKKRRPPNIRPESPKRRRIHSPDKTPQICLYFTRYGKCRNGLKCPFTHDPRKVAVCTNFLRGKCSETSCTLRHSSHLKNHTICHYFLQGICTNSNCPFTHVKVNENAATCPDFVKGYCPRGTTCKLKHIKQKGEPMCKVREKKKPRPSTHREFPLDSQSERKAHPPHFIYPIFDDEASGTES